MTRVINCSLRHYDPAVSVEIARLSVAYRDRGVVAFDLAGGEAGRPPRCARGGVRRRAGGQPRHHGPRRARRPAPSRSPTRSAAAMRIASATAPGCTRIPALLDYVRDRRILIEINITSNVQTHAVARAAEHPVRAVLRRRGGGHPLHRRLADVRRHAHRRVLAGPHRARLHPRGDRPDDPHAFGGAFLPWPERQALVAARAGRAGGGSGERAARAARPGSLRGARSRDRGCARVVRAGGRRAGGAAARRRPTRVAPPAQATPPESTAAPVRAPVPLSDAADRRSLGLAAIIGIGVALSRDRRSIRWRVVAWGLGLQVTFAIFVLRVPAGQALFRGLGAFVTARPRTTPTPGRRSSSASWASRTRASA